MSHEKFDSDHVRFSLDDPTPPDIDIDPPPYEPLFEDLTPPRSLPPPRRRPLDPPPPCFSTPSPLRIRSHDFPTFHIPAVSDKLTDGFRVLYPQGVLERHGIYRADWVRFLQDLGIAARLSSDGLSAIRSRVPVSPLLVHHIYPPRVLGSVYDRNFAHSPLEEVRALVQIWNQAALERRKIRVSLRVRPIGTNGKKSCTLIVESL